MKMKRIFACFVMVFIATATNLLAQSDKLNTDLSKEFKRFQTTRIGAAMAAVKAKNWQPIELQIDGRILNLLVKPNDMRSADYQQFAVDSHGNKTLLPKTEVFTFAGTVENINGSTVRLNLNGKTIEGLIIINGKTTLIENARKFSKVADGDDVVVYSPGDSIGDAVKECGLEKKITMQSKIIERQVKEATFSKASFSFNSPVANGLGGIANRIVDYPAYGRVVEIMTDADFQLLSQFGTPPSCRGCTHSLQTVIDANADIVGTLNLTEPLFADSNNFRTTFQLNSQFAWIGRDPYDLGGKDTTVSDSIVVLERFKEYWNANRPISAYKRDTAILFSGKGLDANRAFRGTLCSYFNGQVDSSYVLFTYNRYYSSDQKKAILAHELSHNFNATHLDDIAGRQEANPSCYNSIQGQDNPNYPFYGQAFRVCQFTVDEVDALLIPSGGCLFN